MTMEPLAEKALKAVEKGELAIMPERFEKVYKVTGNFCVIGFTGVFPLLCFPVLSSLTIIVWVYSMIHIQFLHSLLADI